MLRIGVDIGGTFTDFAAWREGSPDIYTTKVPSTPPQFAEGFKQGFEGVLAEFKPDAREAVYVVHGTTVSTNTVIERSGPAIALLTTKGFRDILELQRLRLRRPLNLNEQSRHCLYAQLPDA
jgi:N-methylhydantoinase A